MKILSALIILIFFSFHSIGSIIHTDIKDTTFITNGDKFELDLNDDSIIDFLIDLRYPQAENHNQVTLIHQGQNRGGVEKIISGLGKLAWGLALNDTIGSNLKTWMTTGNGSPHEIFMAYYAQSTLKGGAFINGVGYLPLEFRIGSNIHYGWIKLSCNDKSTGFTVFEYAYEDIPDKPIVIAKKVSTYSEGVPKTRINIFPNPAVDQINVSTNHKDSQLIICTIEGNITKQLALVKGDNIISSSDLLNGLYIFTVRCKKGIVSKRIMIQRE